MNKVHAIYIIIIVILVVVIIGGGYYFHTKAASMTRPGQQMMGKGGRPGMNGMGMTSVTPPTVSEQQQQQITAGTATTTKQKTFNITGGNFYFVPNKITVNKGDSVTFVMTNAGGMHDLVIDDLGVKTPLIKTGETTTVTFTASKTGSFVYYCSVPGHKSKGMWGTLVVQ